MNKILRIVLFMAAIVLAWISIHANLAGGGYSETMWRLLTLSMNDASHVAIYLASWISLVAIAGVSYLILHE